MRIAPLSLSAAGICFVLSVFVASAAETPPAVRLKAGDRIVFLGDTSTGQHGYTAYVSEYFALRRPEMKLSFRTSSDSGLWRVADGTVNALPKYQADALDVRPSVVVVSFGGDDAASKNFNARQFPYFTERLARVVRELKKAGATVILLTPADLAPAGVSPPGEWHAKVVDYERELAAREGILLVDLNARMKELRDRVRASQGHAAALDQGAAMTVSHVVAAFAILEALGGKAPPAAIEIDAVAGKAIGQHDAIDALSVTPDRVTFSSADRVLPLVFPTEVKPVLSLLPGHDMNRYELKVAGLRKGSWKLVVQDIAVGSFSAEELAIGVDLATMPGPWRGAYEAIHLKSIAIEEAFAVRCRYGSEPKIPAGAEPQRQALVRKLDAGIEQLAAELSGAVEGPRKWTWTLTRTESP